MSSGREAAAAEAAWGVVAGPGARPRLALREGTAGRAGEGTCEVSSETQRQDVPKHHGRKDVISCNGCWPKEGMRLSRLPPLY